MGGLQDKKNELKARSDRYLNEIQDNFEDVKLESAEVLKDLLIALVAGFGVWSLGAGLANLVGGKKRKKGKVGKAVIKALSPIAAKVVVDLLRRPEENDEKEEVKNGVPAGQN